MAEEHLFPTLKSTGLIVEQMGRRQLEKVIIRRNSRTALYPG